MCWWARGPGLPPPRQIWTTAQSIRLVTESHSGHLTVCFLTKLAYTSKPSSPPAPQSCRPRMMLSSAISFIPLPLCIASLPFPDLSPPEPWRGTITCAQRLCEPTGMLTGGTQFKAIAAFACAATLSMLLIILVGASGPRRATRVMPKMHRALPPGGSLILKPRLKPPWGRPSCGQTKAISPQPAASSTCAAMLLLEG